MRQAVPYIAAILVSLSGCDPAGNEGAAAGASAGGEAAGSGGASTGGDHPGGAGADPGDDETRTLLGEHVLTWYSFQDNTPSNSAMSASGRPLVPYLSVALPFRYLEQFGGDFAYGDRLWVSFLAGRAMPGGTAHTGWVQIDDYCGDNQDDSYCYQQLGVESYPNVDLWIGDFTMSGLDPVTCSGPAGSGQELTSVYFGVPGTDAWITDYGGRSVGTGACGDSAAARAEQPNCWHYTPPPESAQWCSGCSPITCAP